MTHCERLILTRLESLEEIRLERRVAPQLGDMTDRIYQEILRLRNEGKTASLVTVTRTKGSTPGKALFKMLVYDSGEIMGSVGGGTFEAKAILEASNVIKTQEPKVFRFKFNGSKKKGSADQPICGGEMEVLIEPLIPKPSLYVMGAGHVGQALATIGKILGFKVVIVDDRERYANRTRFPGADEILVLNFEKITEKVKLNNSSYVVIVTRGHQHDKTVLKALVQEDAAYIGMIGSKEKVRHVFQSLIDEGIEERLLDRVYSPIGLDIGAQTPSEIAVSIMAEIIACIRGKIGSVKSLKIKIKK